MNVWVCRCDGCNKEIGKSETFHPFLMKTDEYWIGDPSGNNDSYTTDTLPAPDLCRICATRIIKMLFCMNDEELSKFQSRYIKRKN